MKQIIIARSKTGHTMQYAKWLSEDLSIELVPFKNRKRINDGEYDQIIFATSVFGGNLLGFKEMQKLVDISKIVVLAVGYTEMDKNYDQVIKDTNQYTGPLYYVRGGVALEKLGFMARTMFKMVTKEKESHDYSNKDYLGEIEKFLRG